MTGFVALLSLVVLLASVETASSSSSTRPRTLQRRRETLLGATAESNLDCKGSLSSCVDCSTALKCTKLGSIYRPISTSACTSSALFCVNGACTATPPEDESCNNAPSPVTGFTCNGNGYFPSPSDSKKYYMCVGNTPYEFDCSPYPNTVYSHAKAMCVLRTEVKYSTVSCTTSLIGMYQTWSQDRSVYFVCTDTKPANAYVADCGPNKLINTTSGNCDIACLEEGRLPDPDDSSNYYECIQTAASVFRGPIPDTCPSTTVFDPTSQRCGTK